MRIQRIAIAAGFVVGLVGLGTAYGDVPTAANFKACNTAAREALKAGSASPNTAAPNTKDENRAAQARRGNTPPTDGAGKITDAHDPQLEGMDVQGAKDPVYQAAYRTCMRKAGF
jgi:hypothetical protein